MWVDLIYKRFFFFSFSLSFVWLLAMKESNECSGVSFLGCCLESLLYFSRIWARRPEREEARIRHPTAKKKVNTHRCADLSTHKTHTWPGWQNTYTLLSRNNTTHRQTRISFICGIFFTNKRQHNESAAEEEGASQGQIIKTRLEVFPLLYNAIKFFFF